MSEVRASRKIAFALFALAALGATWLPVFRTPPRDSFPLSTYPMFSSLINPVSGVDIAVGIDASGDDVRLSPGLVAGTDEVIVAGSTVTQAIRAGSADSLCVEISERAADDGDAAIRSIAIRTDVINAIDWYAGHTTPQSSRVHARCEVAR